MKNALSALPCFTQVESISKITSGLSQHCFKVSADNKAYFAKTISDNTEVPVTLFAGISGLSPSIIYHDQHWLISNFIDADNLALSTIDTDDKINHAIKLMVKCHQLNAKPAALSAKDVIKTLLNNSHYTKSQQVALSQLAKLILDPLIINQNGVCCHGDLNFSNVLINQEHSIWLVDYECASTAPIEYDLAMFIAVNSLDSNDRTTAIEQYEVQSSVSIDPQLLNHYLLFCYFINALWYFNSYHEPPLTEGVTKGTTEDTTKNKQALLKYGQTQWHALHSSLKIDNSPLLDRLGIKFTNIFTTLDFSNQT
ncbi:MAG: phosphotransferase [Colwellia sp.]|nr:phosphotransferase [Colwellia sp.]